MLYPIMLNLKNKQCVVVGGGKVAARKVQGVLACGGAITIVSPVLSEKLDMLWKKGVLQWEKACYHERYLDNAFICFACTNDSNINALIAEHSEARGILVNVADCNSLSAFAVPAVRRRGDITISVYANENPGASRYLAQELIDGLEEWQLDYISLINEIRKKCKLIIEDSEKRQVFISSLYSSEFMDSAKRDLKAVEARINKLLEK